MVHKKLSIRMPMNCSIEVIPNYELESCILAFSEKVRVIKPETFRQVIKQRIEKAAGLY